MLVGRRSRRAEARTRWALWLGVAAIVLPLLSLAPYCLSGTEIARARNALVIDDGADASIDWTPANTPKDFLLDDVPPDPMFVEVAKRLKLAALPTDWDRAVAISRHLLSSSPQLLGGPIQSNLEDTYQRITQKGEGYCVDFVRAFSAIAAAEGIPVRSWAFSFDGFGGHGHIFPEIWNRQIGQWQLLDVFDNSYFGITDAPLSARGFRDAMLSGRTDLRIFMLDPLARPGYVHEDKAWAYYRRGLPEWYLWWGNNPFSYEQAWSVRLFSPVSRALAQLGAILQGVHPHIHVLVTPDNQAQIEALKRVRLHVHVVIALVFAGLVLLLWAMGGSRGNHRPGVRQRTAGA